MRRIKFLGMALLAVFAFGVVIAATAQAEEGVTAGLLFLAGEAKQVTMKGAVTAAGSLTVLGLKNGTKIECQKTSFNATAGSGETHVTLGTATIEYTGCKLGALKCQSEGLKATKDAGEVILQVAEDTDIHFVALLNGTKLVPGVLVGLLELKNETEHKDLTIVCGVAKVLVLGAQMLEVIGAPKGAKEDTTKVELAPTTLPCDSADELCKKELTSWGATATIKNGEKDEKVFCPLAAEIEKEEECALLKTANIPVEINPMVEIDF